MRVLLPICLSFIFSIEARWMLSVLVEEKAKRLEDSLVMAGLPTWCGEHARGSTSRAKRPRLTRLPLRGVAG